jgi:hypothetical protein
MKRLSLKGAKGSNDDDEDDDDDAKRNTDSAPRRRQASKLTRSHSGESEDDFEGDDDADGGGRGRRSSSRRRNSSHTGLRSSMVGAIVGAGGAVVGAGGAVVGKTSGVVTGVVKGVGGKVVGTVGKTAGVVGHAGGAVLGTAGGAVLGVGGKVGGKVADLGAGAMKTALAKTGDIGGFLASAVRRGDRRSEKGDGGGTNAARPSYRSYGKKKRGGSTDDDDDDDDDYSESQTTINRTMDRFNSTSGIEINADWLLNATKLKYIGTSAGANRLNRILSSTPGMHPIDLLDQHHADGDDDDEDNLARGLNYFASTGDALFGLDPLDRVKIDKLRNVRDPIVVGRFAARYVIPPLRIDPWTIGGSIVEGYPTSIRPECIVISPLHSFETTGTEAVAMSSLQFPAEYAKFKRSLGLYAGGMGGKTRTKLRFVMIARCTNRPLVPNMTADVDHHHRYRHDGEDNAIASRHHTSEDNNTGSGSRRTSTAGQSMRRLGTDHMGDDSERADYDTMFADRDVVDDDLDHAMKNTSIADLDDYDESNNHDDNEQRNSKKPVFDDSSHPVDENLPTLKEENDDKDDEGGGGDVVNNIDHRDDRKGGADVNTTETTASASRPHIPPKKQYQKPVEVTAEEEISSFPVLICMTLNSDGTAPDVRKLAPLEQLSIVQDLHSNVLQLAFVNGDTVRLIFGNGEDGENIIHDNPEEIVEQHHPLSRNKRNVVTATKKARHVLEDGTGLVEKERFVWSLLQIHGSLCVSVVERNSMGVAGTREQRLNLPPLSIRNLNRAELQYIATTNGYLKNSPPIHELLIRQRTLLLDFEDSLLGLTESNIVKDPTRDEYDEYNELAYNIMIGNFTTRVALFHSEDEQHDAEDILNSDDWTNSLSKEETAALSVAERLNLMLQMRMRDLEAETCRRLIAWEDEKKQSSKDKATFMGSSDDRDTVDALALASLFKTLESLDSDLLLMEDWLQERAAAIKPLTDDCADIEEENRQVEQQWKSYDMLGNEMRRLLQGLELDGEMEKILKNPASALIYDSTGAVDIEESEAGLELIYEAGKTLQEALEYPKRTGALFLKAVAERAQGLAIISNKFCQALAQIIVTVVEQIKSEVVAGSDYGKVSKLDTHSVIARKIRDTQRKFQSALLGYVKLVEVLAALSPEMLPALRGAYSEMVSEGIMMKKRMKGYFQALPGKNAAYLNKVGKDLKDYIPFAATFEEGTVNAADIRAVLSELLPVIAREAYFTSALFGQTTKDQDGREKKRNFENTRAAVDSSSQHFRYYIARTCGILTPDDNAKSISDPGKGDPMLCFVASVYLNEAMDNYIDREKKGGDHSLSLAYVRAMILDLRKKADKQWVVWVDRQIDWIRTNEGVPPSGKKAGVIASFARFPVYLDHLLLCCREGRDESFTPEVQHIKVISYYLQKMAAALLDSLLECAFREGTDQQYAAHVMKMENTYYFSQSVKQRGAVFSDLFAKQLTKANAVCKESTDAYLGWMIKREFATLHEVFSRISKIRKEQGDKEVLNQISKINFVKTLGKEANRAILKEKITLMYTRMEKHISEESGLLPVAWKALVKVLFEWFGRWEKLSASLYRHKLDPSAVDIVKIAKAAGGAGKSKVATDEDSNDFGFKSMMLSLGNKKE